MTYSQHTDEAVGYLLPSHNVGLECCRLGSEMPRPSQRRARTGHPKLDFPLAGPPAGRVAQR
jgi:hypothetical protein